VKLPKLTAYAKAQLWGMAVGFALALHFANQMGLGLGVFAIGALATWLAFEFTLGPREPSHKTNVGTMVRAIAIGFALPWGGFLLAYALHTMRP
jgi:hypothetical protein